MFFFIFYLIFFFFLLRYWRGRFEEGYWMKNVLDEVYGARLLKLYKPNVHDEYIVGKEVSDLYYVL